ncbi:MAG: glycosyltransferase, partial [Chloroflexota bacterium]
MADSFGATGGGEVIVSYLARRLMQRHTVGIVTAGAGPTERVNWRGLSVFQIHSAYHPRLRPAISIVNPVTVGAVRQAVQTFAPDVVHAWNVHHHLGYEALRQAAQIAPVVHTSQDALAFCYTKFHCWIDPTNRSGALPIPRAHPERCRNCRSHFWL